jgi:hypothetical protein
MCSSHSLRSWSALHHVPPSMCVYDVVTLTTRIATYTSSMAGCGDLRASTESHSTIATQRVGASLSPSRHIHFPTTAVRVNPRLRDICRVVFVPDPTPPRLSSLPPTSLKIYSGVQTGDRISFAHVDASLPQWNRHMVALLLFASPAATKKLFGNNS